VICVNDKFLVTLYPELSILTALTMEAVRTSITYSSLHGATTQKKTTFVLSENSEESSKGTLQPRIRPDGGVKILWTQVAPARGRVQADQVWAWKQLMVCDRLIGEVHGRQRVGPAASRMHHSQVCKKFFEKALLSGLTGCKCCNTCYQTTGWYVLNFVETRRII
jgi:hypothetical protein